MVHMSVLLLSTVGLSNIGSSSSTEISSTATIFVSSFSTTQTYHKHAQQQQQHLLSNQRIKTLYKLSSRVYSQRNPSQPSYKKSNNRRKSNNDDDTIQRNNHDRISYNQKNQIKSNKNEHGKKRSMN